MPPIPTLHHPDTTTTGLLGPFSMLIGATALATVAAAGLAWLCATYPAIITLPTTSSPFAHHPWAVAAAAAWLACELIFFLHLRRLHRRLDQITPPPRMYVRAYSV